MMATEIAVATPHTTVRPALTTSTGREGAFLLPHDKNQAERLQRLHYFFKAACDGKQIPTQLLPGSKVLDSGCADGKQL